MSVKVGDEVRVFDVNGNRLGQPEGGWVGRVTKVGRKLVTIQTGERFPEEHQYRIDEGRINDAYGHRWFKTLEQAQSDARRIAALSVLRAVGITIEYRSSLSVEQVEALAAVIKGWS